MAKTTNKTITTIASTTGKTIAGMFMLSGEPACKGMIFQQYIEYIKLAITNTDDIKRSFNDHRHGATTCSNKITVFSNTIY